jgi:nucleoside-diphosphate-sugar epimerase
MARVLIVGCGCRGRELGRELAERGHAIRGTSRHEDGRAAIETAGFEGVTADPGRLGTLLPHLQGVSVLCWLMGGVADPPLHTERFAALLETLVDTHVRGAVYEDPTSAEVAAHAAATHLMPVAAIEEPPGDHARWLAAALEGVASVLRH